MDEYEAGTEPTRAKEIMQEAAAHATGSDPLGLVNRLDGQGKVRVWDIREKKWARVYPIDARTGVKAGWYTFREITGDADEALQANIKEAEKNQKEEARPIDFEKVKKDGLMAMHADAVSRGMGIPMPDDGWRVTDWRDALRSVDYKP